MGIDGRNLSPVLSALLSMAAVVIIIAGIKAATAIVIPVLLAAFIAILCGPLLAWLGCHGVSKPIALFLIISVVVFGGILFVTVLGTSIQDFTKDLPKYEKQLQDQVNTVLQYLESKGMDTSGMESYRIFDAGAIMRYTGSVLNSLSSALTNGFLILMIVIFMLMEASSMPAKLRAAAGEHTEALKGMDTFLESVNRYMAIKTFTSFLTGALITLLLYILKVKYYMLWGGLAFLLNYIPNIGSILASIPAILIALISVSPLAALWAALGYVGVNMVVGNVLEPKMMGQGLGLSTLVVFLSLLFWGWVLGPVGMLLSVPLTMMVKIALDSNTETRWISVLLGR